MSVKSSFIWSAGDIEVTLYFLYIFLKLFQGIFAYLLRLRQRKLLKLETHFCKVQFFAKSNYYKYCLLSFGFDKKKESQYIFHSSQIPKWIQIISQNLSLAVEYEYTVIWRSKTVENPLKYDRNSTLETNKEKN